jgi:hypothetical protein
MLGAFQYPVMRNDPLFQAKFRDVDHEEWLQLKWFASRNHAVIKGNAAIFAAEREDDSEMVEVMGYVRIGTNAVNPLYPRIRISREARTCPTSSIVIRFMRTHCISV